MKLIFALISFTACGKMTSNKNFLFVKNQNSKELLLFKLCTISSSVEYSNYDVDEIANQLDLQGYIDNMGNPYQYRYDVD